MQCLNCNTHNDATANFCKHCGAELGTIFQSKKENKTSDHLLLAYIVITFIMAIAQFSIQRLFQNWFDAPIKYIQGFLWIIQNLSFIILPVLIKDRSLKAAGLVIASIAVLYWIYSNVEFMLR